VLENTKRAIKNVQSRETGIMEEKQGKTPHKDSSMESTKFCETFS